jgi:thiamine pyrophosphokinase
MLVLGGEIRDPELFRKRLGEAAQVFVADSGARHLRRLGMAPQVIYGDLDSLTNEEIQEYKDAGCRFVTSPAVKNDTDGGIVLKEALGRGYRDIRIWGALGGRPDHSYANIVLLQLVFPYGRAAANGVCCGTGYDAGYDAGCSAGCDVGYDAGCDVSCDGGQTQLPCVTIEDGGLSIFLARRGQWIEGSIGDYLSFFAVSPEVTGFTQIGLKYQPEGDRFVSSFPLGVSNEFMQERVWINWDHGILLCMQISRPILGG